jgi:magnesium chelatase accessory protein
MLDWAIEGADWPWREHSQFLEVGPVRWHVQSWGKGPPLLLLHGTGAASHSWRGVAPLLAEHFRLIVPDLPGHGFTRGEPAGGLTLEGIAGAVGALLERLGAANPHVAAHSAGAAIACRLSLDQALVGPITAFCPALLPMGGSAAPLFGHLARLLLLNPLSTHLVAGIARQPGQVGRFLERATGSKIDPEGVALYAKLFRDALHVRGTIAMMSGWRLERLQRALPHLPVGMRIVHGEHDRAIPLTEARRAARLSGASLTVLDGLGHLAHEERPDLAAAAILEGGG